MISEFERYHGVVLRDIIVCSASLTIRKFDYAGRVNCFRLNDDVGLCIKHSTSRLPPWLFTYDGAQMEELRVASLGCRDFWLAHVCGIDGIMALSIAEFSRINPPDAATTRFVRVDKGRSTRYRVFGTNGELPMKKSRGVGSIVASVMGVL